MLAFLDIMPTLGDSLLLAGDVYDYGSATAASSRAGTPGHCCAGALARRIPC